MKKSEIAKRSVYVITEYYKNNIRPFLDSFSSKDCLWIGPGEGQMIRTREALHAAFDAENNQLTFKIYDLEVIPVGVSKDSTDVVCIYTVASYYPNGYINIVRQRTELLWVKETFTDENGNKDRDFFIRVCHISNEIPYAEKDNIYQNHWDELDIAKYYSPVLETADAGKLSIKGKGNSFFYLSSASIMYMSCKQGNTVIHTSKKVYESTEKLVNIVKQYPDTLIRIHASHAINPLAVTNIGRFYVILSDGTKLPIPEKKYTKIKAEINKFIENSRKGI